MKQFIKLCRINPHYRGFLIYKTFTKHVHCHVQGSGSGPFACTALKHVKNVFLDSKLHILHVAEGFFQYLTYVAQFLVRSGHDFFHALQMHVLFVLCFIVQGTGGADTCNNILALGIDQPFAVEQVFTGGGVTRECNTRC